MKPKRLSDEEYKAWWPFERLDPKRFPLPTPQPKYPDGEESPI